MEPHIVWAQVSLPQVAVYKGTVPGHEAAYALDRGCVLQAGCSTRVSGNTAAILSDSWLAPHFEARICRALRSHVHARLCECVLTLQFRLCDGKGKLVKDEPRYMCRHVDAKQLQLTAVHAAQVSGDRAQHLGRFATSEEAWPPAGIFDADAVPAGAQSCCA